MDYEVDTVPIRMPDEVVAGGARTVICDGDTRPHQAVEECALADIGAAYKGDNCFFGHVAIVA